MFSDNKSKPPPLANAKNSLTTQIVWRVGLLSVLALMGVLLSMGFGISLAALQEQRVIQNRVNQLAFEFDLLLERIETDVEVVAYLLDQSTNQRVVLRELLERHPNIFRVMVINAQGDVQIVRQRVGVVHPNEVRPPLLTPFTEPNSRWSAIYSSETLGNVPFIDLSAPIFVTDAQSGISYSGALVVQIDLSSFWETVRQVRLDDGSYAYLLDNEGRVLTHPNLNLALNTLAPPPIRDRITGQQTGFSWFVGALSNLEGDTVISGGISLRTLPWHIVMEQPIGAFYRQLYPLFIFALGITALLVVLIANTIWFTRQRIVSPLGLIRERVDKFRKGDMKQRIYLSGMLGDEIDVLSRTFNQMADSIELRTEELIIANAKSLESSRLKSEFLSILSHELRTPLNAIMGYCGLMLEGMSGKYDDEVRRLLGRIDLNSRRLLALIDDLLDLSKIEAGKMDVQNKPFNPHELVRYWDEQSRVLFEQKSLNFIIEVDPALPPAIMGDRERLTQIAVNLLSNAAKFTESGSVLLEVRSHVTEWSIRVTDTGIGIPAHALTYIFEKFRQVDGSPTRAYGGTGLGLSIVSNLAQLMGGRVQVESTLNVGSKFTVFLPLIPPREPQPAPPQEAESPQTQEY